MSAPDSTPSATRPGESAEEPATVPAQVSPPLGNALAVSRRGKFLAFLRDLWIPERRPFWLAAGLGTFIGVPQVADAFRQWHGALGGLGGLGGDAVVFLTVLASPGLAIALIAIGAWGVLSADGVTGFGRAVGAFGRLLAVALIAVFAATALFGHLIASSDIAPAVKHFQRTTAVRQITPRQRDILFQEFRRTTNVIPSFQVLAGRDPETVQYADELVDALLAAGLRLDNGVRPEAKAIIVDLRSTDHRGLMIAVKNLAEPPRAATLLGNALKSARIAFEYINLDTETGDRFLVLIGPN